MKKIILSLICITSLINQTNAQVSANCKNTCEKSVVVLEGVFLGVQINNGPTGKNAQIVTVFDNTAAKENNLAINDIIVSVDDEEIQSKDHLVSVIGKHKANDKVAIKYVHNNTTLIKRVTLGAKKTSIKKELVCCDELLENNVEVYPNPATTELNVNYKNNTGEPLLLRIYTLEGKEIVKMTFNNDLSLHNYSLNNFVNGEYLINVSNTKINKTEKFLKLNN